MALWQRGWNCRSGFAAMQWWLDHGRGGVVHGEGEGERGRFARRDKGVFSQICWANSKESRGQ